MTKFPSPSLQDWQELANKEGRGRTANDLIWNTPEEIPVKPLYTRDDLVTEYRKLIDAFASLPTAPYIIQWSSLAPLFPGQNFHGDPNVETLNEWLPYAVAHTGVDTIDMFTPLKDHPEWFPDHIHPNAEGSKAIAETTFQHIQKLDRAIPVR